MDREESNDFKTVLYDICFNNNKANNNFNKLDNYTDRVDSTVVNNFRNSFIKRANSEQQQRINALADAMLAYQNRETYSIQEEYCLNLEMSSKGNGLFGCCGSWRQKVRKSNDNITYYKNSTVLDRATYANHS